MNHTIPRRREYEPKLSSETVIFTGLSSKRNRSHHALWSVSSGVYPLQRRGSTTFKMEF